MQSRLASPGLKPRDGQEVSCVCTCQLQVRLSAMVARDGDASKSGGPPYSHRAFGELIARALQVGPLI